MKISTWRILGLALLVGWMPSCGSKPNEPDTTGSTTTTTLTTTTTTTLGPATTTTTTTTRPPSTSTTNTTSTTTSTTTTSTTTTTTTMTVSFASVVRPQMAPGTGACDTCHTGNYGGNPYAWASARSVSGNPGGSLFLQKPSGAVSHGGGTRWANGSAGYNAAVSWINGGLKP